ncbi:hypothetical protein DPMN_044908 [Dreissena polymorpha]|uniref:Uncharacterized protein n=1 Tax=Dreissena polymorpha TaxID=45954 RepID=A0A9D4D5G8_DREPO|nr:hypothetical protein DPMN_044908 [Dreissena polymorpha]
MVQSCPSFLTLNHRAHGHTRHARRPGAGMWRPIRSYPANWQCGQKESGHSCYRKKMECLIQSQSATTDTLPPSLWDFITTTTSWC